MHKYTTIKATTYVVSMQYNNKQQYNKQTKYNTEQKTKQTNYKVAYKVFRKLVNNINQTLIGSRGLLLDNKIWTYRKKF